jgi:hypothetical protein
MWLPSAHRLARAASVAQAAAPQRDAEGRLRSPSMKPPVAPPPQDKASLRETVEAFQFMGSSAAGTLLIVAGLHAAAARHRLEVDQAPGSWTRTKWMKLQRS